MLTVRYFAAARAAAGVSEETVAAHTLTECLALVSARHGAGLVRVLAAASFLVDGIAAGDREQPLAENAVVDILPPFAGG